MPTVLAGDDSPYPPRPCYGHVGCGLGIRSRPACWLGIRSPARRLSPGRKSSNQTSGPGQAGRAGRHSSAISTAGDDAFGRSPASEFPRFGVIDRIAQHELRRPLCCRPDASGIHHPEIGAIEPIRTGQAHPGIPEAQHRPSPAPVLEGSTQGEHEPLQCPRDFNAHFPVASDEVLKVEPQQSDSILAEEGSSPTRIERSQIGLDMSCRGPSGSRSPWARAPITDEARAGRGVGRTDERRGPISGPSPLCLADRSSSPGTFGERSQAIERHLGDPSSEILRHLLEAVHKAGPGRSGCKRRRLRVPPPPAATRSRS